MTFDKQTILTNASVIALIITTVFVAGITIAADLVPPIKSWLAATHGHHWVGKGIWTIILFVLSTIVFYASNRDHMKLSPRMVMLSGHVALAASVIMTLFFVYEYLA